MKHIMGRYHPSFQLALVEVQVDARCPDNAFYDFNFAPRDGSPATGRRYQAEGWRRWPGQIANQADPNSVLSKTWRIRTFLIRQLLSAKQ